MRKIQIKELKSGWQLTMGGGARKRRTAILLYNQVERKIDRFLASSPGDKTAVRVVYGDGSHNESLNSNDTVYLLYTLGCFLEDYLSEPTFKRIERRYLEDYDKN